MIGIVLAAALLSPAASACSCSIPAFDIALHDDDVVPTNIQIPVTLGRRAVPRGRVVPTEGGLPRPLRRRRLKAGRTSLLYRSDPQRIVSPLWRLRPDTAYQLVLGRGADQIRVDFRTDDGRDTTPPEAVLSGPLPHSTQASTRSCDVAGMSIYVMPESLTEPVAWAVWLSPGSRRPDAIVGGFGTLGTGIGQSHTCHLSPIGPLLPLGDGAQIAVQPIDRAGNRGQRQVLALEPWGWLDLERTVPAGASLADVEAWLARAAPSPDEIRAAFYREMSWAEWGSVSSLEVPGGRDAARAALAALERGPSSPSQEAQIALRWLVLAERVPLPDEVLQWCVSPFRFDPQASAGIEAGVRALGGSAAEAEAVRARIEAAR